MGSVVEIDMGTRRDGIASDTKFNINIYKSKNEALSVVSGTPLRGFPETWSMVSGTPRSGFPETNNKIYFGRRPR
jgi:hypothetical protein